MRKVTNNKRPRRLIVFTDLDGSLMNHSDYSWEAAKPALQCIREKRIPLVICTSKTRREVEVIRSEMDISGPFIVENGGGIFFPPEYETLPTGGTIILNGMKCIPLGLSYSRIRSFMKESRKVYSIRGFGDMSLEEVSVLTGLPAGIAALAKEREFSEPFVLMHEDELDDLIKTANLKGLLIARGGRFFHCMGFGNDKGSAVKRVIDVFTRHWNARPLSIGFGDSPNDFPLLKAVDIPILIPHEDCSFEELDLPDLVRAKFPGSRGWNEALLGIMNDKGSKTRRSNIT